MQEQEVRRQSVRVFWFFPNSCIGWFGAGALVSASAAAAVFVLFSCRLLSYVPVCEHTTVEKEVGSGGHGRLRDAKTVHNGLRRRGGFVALFGG